MFKSVTKFLLTALLAASFGVTTLTTNVFKLNNPITVSAHAVQSDGPWETGSNGLPALQHLNDDNTIYYSIAPHTKYGHYANSAAAAWNNLGVINLQRVPWGDSRSQITVSYDDEDSPDDDADADTSFSNMTSDGTNDYIGNATITLYDDMEEDTTLQREIILEHEFGHALGFAHDNRHLHNGRKFRDYDLTMSAESGQDDTYVLGGIEQRTLADHYNITPDTWNNHNC